MLCLYWVNLAAWRIMFTLLDVLDEGRLGPQGEEATWAKWLLCWKLKLRKFWSINYTIWLLSCLELGILWTNCHWEWVMKIVRVGYLKWRLSRCREISGNRFAGRMELYRIRRRKERGGREKQTVWRREDGFWFWKGLMRRNWRKMQLVPLSRWILKKVFWKDRVLLPWKRIQRLERRREGVRRTQR